MKKSTEPNVRANKRAFASFYEEVGAHYPEAEEVYRTLRGRLRKAFVLSYLQRMRGSLLDVGCNNGLYLSAYQHGDRYGIDISRNVLRRVPKQLLAHLVVADAERLYAFKPASFDQVLCSEVLEHCLRPISVFAGIAHVLKPGGRALLTTPNYTTQRPEWVETGELLHYGIHGDFNGKYYHTAYQPQELCDLAKSEGLTVLASGTLEKEIKYAAKLPAALLLAGRLLNRLFKSVKVERWLLKGFNLLSIGIYEICRTTRLDAFFLRFIDQGVRSYVWLEKPSRE